MLSIQELMSFRKSIRFRSKDIQDYSDKLSRREPYRGKAPYMSVFKKGPYELTFVAVKHVYGSKNSTCKTIQKAFKTREIKCLIYEGDLVGEGENVFAAKLAKRLNIPTVSADPQDAEIKKYALKKGYTNKELNFFYSLRQIPQIVLRGIKTDAAIRRELKATKQFEMMYLKNFGHQIKYSNVTPTVVAPLKNGPYWSNQISYLIGQCREKAITKCIQKNLSRYQKVMIVYGQGHLVQQRKVLTAALGKSKNFSAP